MTNKRTYRGRPKRRARRIVSSLGRSVRTTKATDALSRAVASGALAQLLTYFAVRIDATPHLRAIMRHAGLSARSLQNELSRLDELGVVSRNRTPDGHVHIRLNASNPAWPPLEQLVRVLADPANILRLALIDIPGIQAAYVFGSFAIGTQQPDSDLDVMLIGEHVDARLLARRTLDVGTLLGREVNILEVTPADLTSKIALGRRFYRNVVKGPKRWVIGDAEQLPPAARSIAAA